MKLDRSTKDYVRVGTELVNKDEHIIVTKLEQSGRYRNGLSIKFDWVDADGNVTPNRAYGTTPLSSFYGWEILENSETDVAFAFIGECKTVSDLRYVLDSIPGSFLVNVLGDSCKIFVDDVNGEVVISNDDVL